MYNIIGTTITLTRGDSFNATVTIFNASGTKYTPVSTDTITFAMKKTYWDKDALITKAIAYDDLLLDLDPEDTAELATGRYVYDIDLVNESGDKDTFISGVLLLNPEV